MMLLILGPRLLQLGAEKDGREELVRSLLSLLTTRLELGSSRGRGVYSSYQGGGGGEEREKKGREVLMITEIELI